MDKSKFFPQVFEAVKDLFLHYQPAASSVFSNDGELLYFCGNAISEVSTDPLRILSKLNQSSKTNILALSFDDLLLASGEINGKNAIYEVSMNPLRILSKFNQSSSTIDILALSFDGSLLASGDFYGKVSVFETFTKNLIFSI